MRNVAAHQTHFHLTKERITTILEAFNNLDSGHFELLITELFNKLENTRTYLRIGRSGQKQYGLDIYSQELKTAIQCKLINASFNDRKLTRDRLAREAKSDVLQAKEAPLVIRNLFVVSTFDHDAQLQYEFADFAESNDLPFNLHYLGWQELRRYIFSEPLLIEKFFPAIASINKQISFAGINVRTAECAWVADPVEENSFLCQDAHEKPIFPIFDFSFVNNTPTTVILHQISIRTLFYYSGLHGDNRRSGILQPTASLKIRLSAKNDTIIYKLPDPIYAESKAPVRIICEFFYEDGTNRWYWESYERHVFLIDFIFNESRAVSLPPVYMNHTPESPEPKLTVIE